jgi:purine-cytosine permease-like protein
MKKSSERSFFEREGTVRALILLVVLICTILMLIDFFFHRHGHFGFEQWYGFYALIGFFSYLFIVNAAKLLRKMIQRDSHYYDAD